MGEKKKRLIIIDSNSLIHRAFYALPPLSTKKGEAVGAVYGFLLAFFKALKDFQPDFVVACFDFPALTFRHQKFKEYKAKRPAAPKELYQQIPLVKEILKSFNIPIFEKEGFEADDLIGTISHLAPKKQIIPEIETIILTGDLDALQLVDRYTKVYFLKRGIKGAVLYDEKTVEEKYQGLRPEQLIDFRALKGDPSDNIPGVPGVGEKTAIRLIKAFGSLENLYREIQNPKFQIPEPLKRKLLATKEQVFFSKMLVQLRKDAPIDFNLKKCRWEKYDKEKAIQILKNLEFQSLIARLPELQTKKTIGATLRLW